jgi:hypothetical protein
MSLSRWAKSHGIATIKVGDTLLIDNAVPVTKKEAHNMNPKYILRWRRRVCEESGKAFDITERGFGYRQVLL